MPNFIEIGETTLEKRVTNFLILQYFGSLGGLPGPMVTGMYGGVHQPPSSYLQNFVPFRRPLFEIYLLPNFVYFVAGVTHKNKHVSTCGDKNTDTHTQMERADRLQHADHKMVVMSTTLLANSILCMSSTIHGRPTVAVPGNGRESAGRAQIEQ